MRILILALILSSALPATPAQARETLRLQPSTKWVVEYADEACRLARNFGEGKERVTLVLDQFQPGDWFRITLTGKPLRLGHLTRDNKLTLRFGPREAETSVTAEVGVTKSGEPVLLVNGSQRLAPWTDQEEAAAETAASQGRRFDPEPIGEAREAAATRLEIAKALTHDIVLETGPMDKPLAALRACSWDLVKSWGLDVDQQKTLTRKARPKRSAENWFHPADYPMSMVREGYEGIVNLRLLVDAAGKPTSCSIQTSTHPKQFDKVACSAVMRRAEFEPALDAQGKPVPSYWISTVHFRLCC